MHNEVTTPERWEGPLPRQTDARRARRGAQGAGACSALPVEELAGRCREEAAGYRRGTAEPGDCGYELLRRAVCEADQAAWAAAVAQYRGLVLAWAHQHPAFGATDEDDDYWVNRTFERFWAAVPPERFRAFPGLPALLSYLKLCVGSVVVDDARRRTAGFELRGWQVAGLAGGAAGEEAVLGELAGRELWRAVEGEVRDEAERLVAHLCLVLDLKPREVYARHPDRFASVADVYRVKRNLLDRLVRNPAIRRFLD